jgi:hypothetical protein
MGAMAGSMAEPEMTSDDVCRFLDLADAHSIRIWLDGGWAVDACHQHHYYGDVRRAVGGRRRPPELHRRRPLWPPAM